MLKLVTLPPGTATAHQLAQRLRDRGIDATVIVEKIETLPVGESVWISRDGDVREALAILRDVQGEHTYHRCLGCGYDLSGHEGSTACPECGRAVTATPGDVTCPRCGKKGPRDFDVCWNCGAER